MKRAVVILLAALAAAAVPAANARHLRTLDTLQLAGTFKVIWQLVDCPAGTPQTTACDLWTGQGVVAGLGAAQEGYTVHLDEASGCLRAHWTAALTVAGRGEIDATMQIPVCLDVESPKAPAAFIITGGSGIYAGATGSGTLTSQETGDSGTHGSAIDTWQGTLSVPGLSFDTTPPTISGAANLHLKTRNPRGVRVSYTLSASDPTDGSLPVSCKPASGSRFRIGRTRVSCSATDKDGNTAVAAFTVTVTRSR